MNLHTVKTFRHRVSDRFEQAADALFNTVDALSSEPTAQSIPELSLSPFFVRTWPSLYEACEDGQIDADRLREVFVPFAPLPCAGQHVFLGVDTRSLFRPEALTSADRTLLPIPNVPEAAHAVSPGWVISSVVLLPHEAGQGTFVLDSQRVASTALATEVAATQVLEGVDLLVARGLRPVIIGDRWYACAPFLARLTDVPARCLLRVKATRVFSRPAPIRQPGQRGASRKDGARFQCSDPSTHGAPDASWEGVDACGKRVEVFCWTQVHLRTARWVEVSVIQVIRHGASERRRDPTISWCVWKGFENEPAPLAEISPTSRLRSSQEHGYRLDTQVVVWDVPRLRPPQQTERWTQMVACAHNQLVLARPLGGSIYRPWEHRRSLLTVAQVRRAMPTIVTQLGTPARLPQPRGKAPGRPKGFRPKPAARSPVIRTTSKKENKRKTAAST
jgi:hypothetical protein